MSHSTEARSKESYLFIVFTVLFQVICLVLFWVFVDFSETFNNASHKADTHHVSYYYKTYSDVCGMIFVGFGFLMTFLRKHGFTAVGINFFVSCLTFQWVVLVIQFFYNASNNFADYKIHMDLHACIDGLFGVATVLITFGGIIGKVTPSQLLLVSFIEVFFYALNFYIGNLVLKAIDIGGSMYIHMFGAYFGLACSWVMSFKDAKDHPNQQARVSSDLFSIIGTIFLWMYWPSFNGAFGTAATQQRAFINTLLSLCGSVVATFLCSRLFRGKFTMEDVQNATVAGGVAMGTSADIIVHPGGAIVVGLISGTVSTFGFAFLTKILNTRLGLHDTCGIHNLHAMPGLLGALTGILTTGIAYPQKDIFGDDYDSIFPKGVYQPLFQLIAIAVTLGISISSGALTGLVIRWLLPPTKYFDDSEYWHVPEDFERATAPLTKLLEIDTKKVEDKTEMTELKESPTSTMTATASFVEPNAQV